eukprot:CAMPEP_0202459264 /NCGR_PEP_ID=MMETSP1360-20130828/34098_1 /ASSEMBLY_ACC=CAM_ASM_000848 /TAXON_ID=515479 /ORGANISM="Licmophora paradoxa, Strain CCMP2313" /LENGTH=142 /DNA_ID=CAMNT_0049080255 /DNA_START=71 /DNA_END=499 /DNA_ORIENTATION=-
MKVPQPKYTEQEPTIIVQGTAAPYQQPSIAIPVASSNNNNISSQHQQAGGEGGRGSPPSSGSGSSSLLGSKRQITGAAVAGGIGGLLLSGPVVGVALAVGGAHLARKNEGTAGDFCRKSGDFTARMGGVIKEEWKKSKSRKN